MKLYICRIDVDDDKYKVIEVPVLKETNKRYYFERSDSEDRVFRYNLKGNYRSGNYFNKTEVDHYMFEPHYSDPSKCGCRIISTTKISPEVMLEQITLYFERKLRDIQYEIAELQKKQSLVSNKLNSKENK